jgi:coproporphyrinogen III oxidase
MTITPSSLADEAEKYFRALQVAISGALEKLDGRAAFREDLWNYDGAAVSGPRTGGGATRVLECGALFEKAGVNFSAVRSPLTPRIAERIGTTPQMIYATGISLVLHPLSPMIPTVHMNLRYLQMENGDAWFGGGADLTPYYLATEDATHFHKTFRAVCDRFDATWYPRFKQWCDEYFYLPHRSETRGIGGIFFDNCRDDLPNFFRFVRECGDHFTEAYIPIVERRKTEPWSEREKTWQELRRGRYAEFNLLHDQGTLFGLETGGRIESIFISLPPCARWQYDENAVTGARERELLETLRHPKNWL